MTQNRRIVLNIVATYGRSLFALFCGVFTARWVLNSLGAVDYGLYGVIGGLIVFISFLNSSLASASSRYYAVSIGSAKLSNDYDMALKECQWWFNTAVSIHTIVPFLLILIGYPVGVWAVRSFLTIPPERLTDCIWVFRLTCLSCFVGMVNVPFMAMYTAKQYIAELTIYGYIATVCNFCFFYYMMSHPQVWLLKYAIWCSLVSIVPNLLICIRALLIFPECKLKLSMMFNRIRLRSIASFAGWNLLGHICQLLRIQGVSILVNRSFGPTVNAAMALGNTVDGHSSALSSALSGAFSPAIANAYGAGDLALMRNLSFGMCKFSVLLQLIFVVPLVAELDQVLVLWLKNPPAYTGYLCLVALITHLVNVSTSGHYAAFSASGKIKEYQINMSYITILTLPVAIVVVLLGGGVYSLGVVLICAMISISVRRVYFARLYTGMSAKHWIVKVATPLIFVTTLSTGVAFCTRAFMSACFARIIVTTILSEMVLLPLSWFLVLNTKERGVVVGRIKIKLGMV